MQAVAIIFFMSTAGIFNLACQCDCPCFATELLLIETASDIKTMGDFTF